MRNYVVLACIASVAILFTGCSGPMGEPGTNGTDGPVGVPGNVGPQGPAYVAPPETDVQTLVDTENAWRELNGQTSLSTGLSCSVQAIASGMWLSNSSVGYQVAQGVVTAAPGTPSYSYLYTDSFNQPDTGGGVNNLLPVSLQPLYESNNYKISCSGAIVVTTNGYYTFDVNSDDGSILTIDGSQVVNNDGNHGMTDKVGTKLLRAGVHTFSMLYAQSGGGNFGLILQANASVVPGSVFYH